MEFIQFDNFLRTSRFFLLYFLIFPGLVQADSPTDPFNQFNNSKSRLQIGSGYEFSSDAITNNLAQSYFLAKFISSSIKDEVSKHAYPVNRFGADAGYSISYSHKLDSFFHRSGFSWNAAFSDMNHLHGKFTRDAFELYFRGNAAYAGKTAEMGEFDFSLLHYQQIKIGMSKETKCQRRTYNYSIGLALNIGQKFQSIHSDRANLFTSEDAEYLDIDFDIALRGSDSSKNKMGSMNGLGGSLFLGWSVRDESKNEFEIQLSNLGIIQFNDHSYIVPADSVFRFEGIDATELFDFSDTIRTAISSDSSFVQGFLHRRKTESYQYNLPARLSLAYHRHLTEKDLVSIGLDQVFFSSYLPHGWGKYQHRFNEHHQLGLILGYGGYTVWQAGLCYNLKIGKSWLFQLESRNLSGWINTKSGRAQGAFVSLSKYL
ncbi:MAG: hypothetical protein IPQ03_05450 [Bacteroidetes bacterium]|nr:hypothetical protein [Bacteroidota bacterium]